MLSRSLAIMLAPVLVGCAWILPLSPAHSANALIAGSLAIAVSGWALANDRARFAAALIGAWVALSGFVLRSTPLEQLVTAAWGVSMFTMMIGPFSDPPHSVKVGPGSAGEASPNVPAQQAAA